LFLVALEEGVLAGIDRRTALALEPGPGTVLAVAGHDHPQPREGIDA
jgi:hypothetical protein